MQQRRRRTTTATMRTTRDNGTTALVLRLVVVVVVVVVEVVLVGSCSFCSRDIRRKSDVTLKSANFKGRQCFNSATLRVSPRVTDGPPVPLDTEVAAAAAAMGYM